MNIVLFTHPNFLEHQSMPRFAKMIAEGMRERHHNVEICSAKPFFYHKQAPEFIKKWFGYLDQYLVFPKSVSKKLKKKSKDTLFVFADHALGPWVPLVKHRPHVIHCHDFLAQYSAKGDIKENKVSWTGRQYQLFIRKGYQKGKNFISVSQKTKQDLHNFLVSNPKVSEVVYNGVNTIYENVDAFKSREMLGALTGIDLKEGYLLHVGGNQWYKNRGGIIEIYNSWRNISKAKLPILMIGEKPDKSLSDLFSKSEFKSDIHFLNNITDEYVKFAYSGASLFLFPSLAEGFGWPIAEAMACGCPVLTTNEAPMLEVAGDAACLIPRRQEEFALSWAQDAAKSVEKILDLPKEERERVIAKSIANAQRFNENSAIDKIEQIYLKVIQQYQ